jgi:hypothetical protein
MKRGKAPPTKLDEIVADALRQEAEGSEVSSEEWERISAAVRRYDEPLEEMNPELCEIVADAARQEAEGSELSPEEWERISVGVRRYDEPLEEMSPELWRMVEQMLYPHRRRAATTPPQNHRKTRKIKARQRRTR